MRPACDASHQNILHRYAPTCGIAKPFSISMRQRTVHRPKTAEERFNMLTQGLACLPRDTVAHATTAEERL